MKKQLLSLSSVLILLFISNSVFSQTEYELDSIQQFQHDDASGFLLSRRTHYTYDNGGVRPTEILYLMKESGNWYNDYRFKYTHNSDGNYLTETYQDWDKTNMLWLDTTRGDYEYDEFQNNTVVTYYSYDGTNWNFAGRNTYEFNANNQITNLIFESINPVTSEILKSQIIYTYDENGNNTLMEQQNWNSTTEIWENTQKYVMTYNGNLIMQQDAFTWTGGPDWPATPQSRQIYDYTSNDIYNVTTQLDSGSGLTNYSIVYYTYNTVKPVEIEFKTWVSGAWKESSKYNYNYDGNGNLTEIYSYNWDDGSSAYVYNSKNLYFWSEAQPFVLGSPSQELLSARLYPNPFQDELNISLKSALESEAVLQLHDINGKAISTIELQQGVKSIKLDNPYLAKGVYFLNIKNTKTNQTFKIIKQ